MKELFKSYDEQVLKSKPLIWITALHWILPLALILCVLTYLYGWFLPYSIELTSSKVGDFIYPAVWIATVCVIILLVVYFIRQLRFNALRLHHSLPYKKPYLHFFIFLITIFTFTAIPHMASLGALHKCQFSIDEYEVASELGVLERGITHFVANERFINYRQSQYDTLSNILKKKIIEENISENNERWNSEYKQPSYFVADDTVYLIRCSMNSYSYNHYGDLGYLTLAEAKKEISDFRKVANKYGGRFSNRTPMEHIRERADYSEKGIVLHYSENSGDYNAIKNLSELNKHYSLHQDILQKDNSFYAGSWSFWKYYFTLPFFLSLLLYILSASQRVDLGWALLVGALSFVIGGVLTGLFSVLTSFSWEQHALEWFWLLMISAFLIIYLYIIHGSSLRSGIKRAFAIALHLLSPILFWFYWVLGDEIHASRNQDEMYDLHQEVLPSAVYYDLGYLLLIAVCLVGIYLFNRYYTQRYVYPKD
jgi:hypothetical protein